MGKSGAGALELRNGKDEGGLKQDRQIKARGGEARRNVAQGKTAYAGRPRKPMETQDGWNGGKKTRGWLIRCAALGFAEWEPRELAWEPHDAARQFAAMVDHDEARIMSFGGKTFELEMQAGHGPIHKIEIGGYPVYRYTARIVR